MEKIRDLKAMDSYSGVVSLAPGEQWSVPVALAMDAADGDQIVEIEIDRPVDNSEPITLVYPVTSDTLYGAVPSADSEIAHCTWNTRQ